MEGYIFTKVVMMRLLIGLLFLSACSSIPSNPTIGIQPIGKHEKAYLPVIQEAISEYYGYKTVILPSTEMPMAFFVQIKSPRYRADSIIRHLRDHRADRIDYVIGFTSHDISTTKTDRWGQVKEPASKYQDWGIFGLGFRPGRACVLSSFRLNASASLMKERIQKIALHELGHNLGLPHCDSINCVMRDAAETIKTIDQVKMGLCADCSAKVHSAVIPSYSLANDLLFRRYAQ